MSWKKKEKKRKKKEKVSLSQTQHLNSPLHLHRGSSPFALLRDAHFHPIHSPDPRVLRIQRFREPTLVKRRPERAVHIVAFVVVTRCAAAVQLANDAVRRVEEGRAGRAGLGCTLGPFLNPPVQILWALGPAWLTQVPTVERNLLYIAHWMMDANDRRCGSLECAPSGHVDIVAIGDGFENLIEVEIRRAKGG